MKPDKGIVRSGQSQESSANAFSSAGVDLAIHPTCRTLDCTSEVSMPGLASDIACKSFILNSFECF